MNCMPIWSAKCDKKVHIILIDNRCFVIDDNLSTKLVIDALRSMFCNRSVIQVLRSMFYNRCRFYNRVGQTIGMPESRVRSRVIIIIFCRIHSMILVT